MAQNLNQSLGQSMGGMSQGMAGMGTGMVGGGVNHGTLPGSMLGAMSGMSVGDCEYWVQKIIGVFEALPGFCTRLTSPLFPSHVCVNFGLLTRTSSLFRLLIFL